MWSKKYSKNQQYCEMLLQFKRPIYYLNVFSNVIYSCDRKAEFSASLLQSSVSHDPSDMILICWFAAQEIFLLIINFGNSCAA